MKRGNLTSASPMPKINVVGKPQLLSVYVQGHSLFNKPDHIISTVVLNDIFVSLSLRNSVNFVLSNSTSLFGVMVAKSVSVVFSQRSRTKKANFLCTGASPRMLVAMA